MSTPFFLREDDNELYSSKERKYHELKESLLYDKANKGKLKKKHSPSSSTTDNLSSSGEEWIKILKNVKIVIRWMWSQVSIS